MIPPLDRLTRRGLLRGACSSLLLPFLPSLSWADDPSVPAPRPPKRWATILFANGVHGDFWGAKGEGAAMELSKSLSPLAPHRGRFTVIDSLRLFDSVAAAGLGPHSPYFTNFLSGARLPPRAPFVLAQSCDQLLARTVGKERPVASLALACEQVPYGLTNGVPGMINSTISWSSPTDAVPPQSSPRAAFDELFDAKGLASEKSVLDCLQADMRRMRGELSTGDQRKLDEFTDSVRDLESRIDRAATPPASDAWHPTLSEPDMLRPAQDLEQVMRLPLGARHRLMVKILALAFQMDKTRVATLVLEADGSYVGMGFVPEVGNIGLHSLAHHASVPETVRQYQLTNQYHVSLLASLMDKMQSVDEGGSTLLDNSMVLFGSNVRDGNLHDAYNLPLVLAGGGGGTLKPGRHLSFEKDEDRRLCNLHLALLQRMGVTIDGKPIQRFGTSLKPLEGI
jgi:hypothetical protein